MLMLALRLFLKDKGGGKQHFLIPFVGSDLSVETFLKNMEHQEKMRYTEDRGTSVYFAFVYFNCFLVIKRILKALFSFIPWLLNLSDLPMAQIWGKEIH